MTERKESLTSTITDFEKLFAKLNKHFFNNELETPVISVCPDLFPKGSLGWFTTTRVWKAETGREMFEINICADHMERDLLELAETLLHEMVHLFNQLKGVKDCTRGGYYHNKAFKTAAESHGLICDECNRSNGYGITKLSESAAAWISSNCGDIYRMSRQPWKKKQAKKSNNSHSIKYVCPCCGAIARTTKALFLVCGDCEERMIEDF